MNFGSKETQVLLLAKKLHSVYIELEFFALVTWRVCLSTFIYNMFYVPPMNYMEVNYYNIHQNHLCFETANAAN